MTIYDLLEITPAMRAKSLLVKYRGYMIPRIKMYSSDAHGINSFYQYIIRQIELVPENELIELIDKKALGTYTLQLIDNNANKYFRKWKA